MSQKEFHFLFLRNWEPAQSSQILPYSSCISSGLICFHRTQVLQWLGPKFILKAVYKSSLPCSGGGKLLVQEPCKSLQSTSVFVALRDENMRLCFSPVWYWSAPESSDEFSLFCKLRKLGHRPIFLCWTPPLTFSHLQQVCVLIHGGGGLDLEFFMPQGHLWAQKLGCFGNIQQNKISELDSKNKVENCRWKDVAWKSTAVILCFTRCKAPTFQTILPVLPKLFSSL